MTIEVFGITGTNGKTTTSWMLRNILKVSGKKTNIIGTINHQIGNNIYEHINTTPGADRLDEYFKLMEQDGTNCCVMEVSSHGLVQGRTADIDINYGSFTNLTRDHLDYHETMENYYQAKKLLFEQCSEGGIINIDDSWGMRMYKELLESSNIKFNVDMLRSCSFDSAEAFYRGCVLDRRDDSMDISLHIKGEYAGTLCIMRPGMFWAYDAIIAAAMAHMAGISFDDIARGIGTTDYIPGRWETVWSNDRVQAIVDFAHTPDALQRLLKPLRKACKGNLICVFGCGGERDKAKRQQMGRIAGMLCDYVIITSDNPRREDPQDIVADIEEGIYNINKNYAVVINRGTAIKEAVAISRNGDIIVVAGKGHERYQIIGDTKLEFDDRILLTGYLRDKYS